MAELARPRRSVLYMPGSNARALEKAKSLPADAVILDLEDAVAPDAKEAAREQVCQAVGDGGYGGRELIIRANGLDTDWGLLDIQAAAAAGPDAILIPKVDSADLVNRVDGLLQQAGAPSSMKIWCMMETPLGLLHAEEIAGSNPRVECLVMGTNDIAKDLHASHTPMRLPFITSLGLCMLAARAFGLSILDGVYNDLQDDQGFVGVCVQGREMGFDGKTLIHPKQVGPCNDVFAPSAEELEQSHKIIAAFAEARSAGQGVVVVDGRMIENLHVANAERQVAMAEAISKLAADTAV